MKLKRTATIFFGISLVAFLALGFWYYTKNSYSRESLKLEILGQETIELANEVEYTVKYKNNADLRLEEARLIFEYPENAILDGALRQEKELGDIYPGEEKTFTFKAKLFGKEGEVLIAKAWLNYRPKNLKVRYESSTTFTSKIKSIPLTFEFDIPSRLGVSNETTLRLNYFSNIDYPLSDLRVQIDYPQDFAFIKSSPKGIESNEWEIPVLNRGDGGRIEVTGKITGNVGEEKNFRARIGVWHNDVFIVLKEVNKGVAMTEPSLYISQQINGNPEYVASPGDQLHFQIFFKNIGDKPLSNLFLISKLDSKIVDFTSFKSVYGKFEVGDNSIVFDSRQVPDLQFLDSGDEGEVEFWVDLKDSWDSQGKEIFIKNKIILSQAQKEFVTKVNSKMELSQKGFFHDEVFGNSGPLPPRVGAVTTYTIIWQVRNYNNAIKNARVKAVLPPEIRLTSNIFPDDQKAKLAFDLQSREIVWELGDLVAGRGVNDATPNISFQVALAPIVSQVGNLATIINGAELTGEDVWTGQTVHVKANAVDTSLPDDASVNEEHGRIQ